MLVTPARKITNINNRKKTGCFPSKKNGKIIRFESTLERDYIHLLEIDKDVLSYTEQPITIYYSYNDKKYKYTPDFMVLRKSKTQLIEIKPWNKYKEILDNNNERKKLDAAYNYCFTNNYEFKIITDKHIRDGNLLKNVKYLYMYSAINVPSVQENKILKCLAEEKVLSIGELIHKLLENGLSVVDAKRYIFSLLYHQLIYIDISKPISVNSLIWI